MTLTQCGAAGWSDLAVAMRNRRLGPAVRSCSAAPYFSHLFCMALPNSTRCWWHFVRMASRRIGGSGLQGPSVGRQGREGRMPANSAALPCCTAGRSETLSQSR